ncbi:hypothetical protein BGZ82_001179 [Podila clonocystis]|nr:hypothetical protein BGZ82_001179 [Podila clonocystis]
MHLHNQGFSWTQISEAVGVPYSSCYKRYCTFLDPNLDSFWTKRRLALLEKMALEGRPWKEIALSLQAGQDKPVSVIACQEKWDRVCRRYKSDVNLSPNNLATLRTEIEKFQSANKSLDWDEIAGVLGNKFTGSQLKFKYSLVTRGASRWRRAQDMDLIRNVMLATAKTKDQTNKQDVIDWAHIADQLGHHTPQECESRWQKMRARLVQKQEISPSGNFWSEKEMEAYWKAWTAFGNDWVKVAESLAQAPWNEESETQQNEGRGLLLLKTAHDCQTDFDYLVRESSLRADLLKSALGDFVETLSMQPRRRAKWTTEQIRRLLDSVERVHDAKQKKLLDIDSSRTKQTPPSIFNTDWDEVARVSGGKFTPEQCRYRWDRETHPDKFLSPAAGVWGRKETQALERALHDYGLLSGAVAKKLPQKFINAVKDQYNVERSSRGIKAKAHEMLRKHYDQVSPASSQARLSSLVNMGLPVDNWTTEEDQRLLQATYESGYTRWDRISRLVFHRQKSAWQCRLRSIQLSQSDVPGMEDPHPFLSDSHRPDMSWIKGQREWTEQEQNHLFDAVEEHGMFGNWDKIQQDLARRSNDSRDSCSVFQTRSVEEIKQEYWRLNTMPQASTPLATYDIDDHPSPSPSPQNTSESAPDESPRLSHPQMFLAPGIMKIRDKHLRQDLRQEGVIDPDLGQGQFGVVWWPEDEKKFAGLIAKYGTSTVSWRLISDKMSIPIKKCQDKLRSMEQAKSQSQSQVKK